MQAAGQFIVYHMLQLCVGIIGAIMWKVVCLCVWGLAFISAALARIDSNSAVVRSFRLGICRMCFTHLSR